MSLHLLIDGPDGTGKTTVCHKVAKKLDLPVIKMPNMVKYFKDNNPEEFSLLFNECVSQFKKYPFVMDRGFTSSLVYSKIYNRDFDLSYIDRIETELEPLVIILTAEQETLLERRPVDEIIENEKRKLIRNEYLNLALEKGYKIVDTTDLTIDSVVQIILNEIEQYGKK